MASLATMKGSDLEKFTEIVKLPHSKQAIWFMNGAIPKGLLKESDYEFIWLSVQKYAELDQKGKADGCSLDELNAHIYLEKLHVAVTVKELRDKLREIGWTPRPMMFPILVALILLYKADWHYIVNAEQGGSEALRKAQAALAEVQKIIAEIEAKKAKLEKEAEGTGVKAGRAKAELAALLSEDPLPLRKALITAEAAVRKAQKEGGDGVGVGDSWWIGRELDELKKYRPKSKQ